MYSAYHPYYPPSTSRRGDDKKNTGKRERTTYTKDQLIFLESEYRIGEYPEAPRRETIALKLGLEDNKIQIWFKNRRAKDRNEKRQIEKMDTLRSSTGSTPSASSDTKSSPLSKVDCSPDSTTVSTSWVKKECEDIKSSPTSATVPTSMACLPTPLVWSSPDSSMTSMAPNSSPPGATVPAPYNHFVPWMMAGTDQTVLPQYPIIPSDSEATAGQAYPMPYYPYNMFYPPFDPQFNQFFPTS